MFEKFGRRSRETSPLGAALTDGVQPLKDNIDKVRPISNLRLVRVAPTSHGKLQFVCTVREMGGIECDGLKNGLVGGGDFPYLR